MTLPESGNTLEWSYAALKADDVQELRFYLHEARLLREAGKPEDALVNKLRADQNLSAFAHQVGEAFLTGYGVVDLADLPIEKHELSATRFRAQQALTWLQEEYAQNGNDNKHVTFLSYLANNAPDKSPVGMELDNRTPAMPPLFRMVAEELQGRGMTAGSNAYPEAVHAVAIRIAREMREGRIADTELYPESPDEPPPRNIHPDIVVKPTREKGGR